MDPITTTEGQVIDQIALAAYGRTAGATEAILAANPHLAGLPPRLPAGVVVVLPVIETAAVVPTVRLWS